jgi:hypothetical protein
MPEVSNGEKNAKYCSKGEELKNILVCELFYMIALDTT